MKIAFFHNLPNGGAKRILFEQAKILSQNHHVSIYQLDNNEPDFLSFSSLPVHIHTYHFTLSNTFPLFLGRLFKDFKNFYSLKLLHKEIAQDIDKKQYDVVIVHPDMFTQAPYLLRFLKTKHIYFCEELLRIVYEKQFVFTKQVSMVNALYEKITRKIRKRIDRKNAQSAKQIVTNSAYTAHNVEIAYQRKAIVNLLGIDEKTFKPEKKKKLYDILFIGEKTSLEGFDLLAKSLPLMKAQPKVYILSKRETQEWITDNELVELYNATKVSVALSRNEPFGLIPIEAMGCGIPIVAINEGGYRETVIDRETGFLVQRDPMHLAKILDTLLESEEVRKKLGEKGRERVLQEFTIHAHVKRLMEIIKIL